MSNESEKAKKSLHCSFCGKDQYEVKKLIAGPTVFICDECVEICLDIIKEGTAVLAVLKRLSIFLRRLLMLSS